MDLCMNSLAGSVTSKGVVNCDICITTRTFRWATQDDFHEHDLTFVIGARVDSVNPYDFSVCIYKHKKKVFQEHVFRTDSYELTARLALNLMLATYSGRSRQKVAILVNPISGKKNARKLLSHYLLPVFTYSPSILHIFGKA